VVVAGVATIAVASACGLVTVFFLWRRLPPVTALALMAVCGMAIGAGGLLVQEDVGPASWAVALVVLGVVTPVHAHLVFGPSGRGDVVAEGPAAA
jgi:4-hydroxybenzoate polyprenyltransferase